MGNHRPYIRSSTKNMINNNSTFLQMNDNGQIVDPNTGKVISGETNFGHGTGVENKGFVSYSNQSGMSQCELNNTVNNAGLYQIEEAKNNQSHQYEESDPNATALNTANYCYLENPSYQENTYINPPCEDGGSWTVTTVNKQTGEESQVGTFNPDLGEVTAESKASVQSAVSSYSSDNQMSDFGTTGSDECSHTESENNSNSDSNGNSNGMSI